MRTYKYFHAKLLFTLAFVAISAAFIERHSDFNKPNIIIIAIPKSGSSYLEAAVRRNLEYSDMGIHSFYTQEKNRFITNFPEFFKNNAKISKGHSRAPINMTINNTYKIYPALDLTSLRRYTNKFILHLRDPRQVLLSHIHFITNSNDSKILSSEIKSAFLNLSLHEKINWGIDNLLPSMIEWYNNWLAIKELEDLKQNGMQILITTYEEILTDDLALYNKILDFYGIQSPKEYLSPPKDAKLKFRKGDPNEYKSIYTAEQQQRIDAIVPKNLLQRFNWDPPS